MRKNPETYQGEACIGLFSSENKLLDIKILNQFENFDDHNVPALIHIAGGSFLVGVTGHNQTDEVVIYKARIIKNSILLTKNIKIQFDSVTTYVHFFRTSKSKVCVATRTNTRTFTGVFLKLFNFELSEKFTIFPWAVNANDVNYSGRDGGRPYLITRRFLDKTYFVLTNDHPRAFRNGVFSGYLKGKKIYDLNGNCVSKLGTETNWDPFNSLTCIIKSGSFSIPWIQDLAINNRGEVTIAVSTLDMPESEFKRGYDKISNGIRYKVYRYLPNKNSEVIFETEAGESLYEKEEHYAAGFAINPMNPNHFIYCNHFPDKQNMENARFEMLSYELVAGCEQIRVIHSGDHQNSYFRPKFSEKVKNSPSHGVFFFQGKYIDFTDIEAKIHCVTFLSGKNCINSDYEHTDLIYSIEPEGAMPNFESKEILKLLKSSNSYLEFGGGYSTLLALNSGCKNITVIDSDLALQNYLKIFSKNKKVEINFVSPYTNKIGPWGYNLSETNQVTYGKTYATCAVKHFNADLVLIDGRYRVACALNIAKHAVKKVELLIDDYVDRPWYSIVEKYLGKPEMIGRLAKFVIKKPITIENQTLEDFYQDPR